LLLAITACPAGDKGAKSESKAGEAAASQGEQAGEADAAQPTLPAKDPADIIAAHVQAAGGPSARDVVKAMHFESKLDTGAQKISARSEHWWQADGKFYEEEDIPGFGVAQLGYDGDTVWSVDPINGARTLTGRERAQALWLADPFHWWHWRDYHSEAKYLGSDEDDEGRTVERIEFDGDAGKVVAAFDAESKLVVGLEYTQVAPTGNVPLKFSFEDYESYGPVKVANKQTAKLPLGEMSQVYEDVEINPSLDDLDFSMPGSDAAVPARPAGDETGGEQSAKSAGDDPSD